MSKCQHRKTDRNHEIKHYQNENKLPAKRSMYRPVNCRKALHYREELIPLIGQKPIEFKAENWSIVPDESDKKHYIAIYMENVRITKVPPGLNFQTMPVLDHIFLFVDKDWLTRNNPHEGDTLKGKGKVHEYYAHAQHAKNIGIWSTELTVKRKNQKPQHAHKYKDVV